MGTWAGGEGCVVYICKHSHFLENYFDEYPFEVYCYTVSPL